MFKFVITKDAEIEKFLNINNGKICKLNKQINFSVLIGNSIEYVTFVLF